MTGGTEARRGIAFVDAPVLGTRQPAEERKLVVLASGPAALRGRVQPVLDAVGRKTMWVGETGAGTRLKLVTNSWVLAVVEAGAETIALAEGLGLDLPVLTAIAQRLGEGARQHGDEDMAATYLTSAPGRAA